MVVLEEALLQASTQHSTQHRHSIRHRVAIVALACVVCAGVASSQRGAASLPQRGAGLRQLTSRRTISRVRHSRTMREEATRIWLRHGVALTWTQQPRAECHRRSCRSCSTPTRLSKLGRGKYEDALAVTIFSGAPASSTSRCRAHFKCSRSFRRSPELKAVGERDLRGGPLIGRVVAHELGHVLLTTLSHSQTGLMRPVFGLRDVLSADDRMTDLSSVETDRLAMRFSLVPLESRRQARAVAPRLQVESAPPRVARLSPSPKRAARKARPPKRSARRRNGKGFEPAHGSVHPCPGQP